MGILLPTIPLIDTIGSHVTYIDGVLFDRLGRHQVLATRYLDTIINGVVTTRDIVGKDAMSIEALMANAERAQIFLRYIADHPVKELATH